MTLTDAWTCAINCRLYEQDPGPAELNIGSELEPHMISRGEAFRDFYARVLLQDVRGDPQRLLRLGRRIDVASRRNRNPEISAMWSIAADLCQRALVIIDGAGAVDDKRARRRLLAGTKHLISTVAIGQWVPDCQRELDNDLLEELRTAEG